MKKLLLSIIFSLTVLSSNAQIYSIIKYVDKFDDVVNIEQRKTLVTITDSTIIIEEKGKKPVEYYILNIMPDETKGSKDNVVNIVGNVYGYQTTWCLVRYDLLDKYHEAYHQYYLDNSKENLNKITPFWIFAIHRTVTTQYTGMYLDELFWLQDDLNDGKLGKDINRVIYLKQ